MKKFLILLLFGLSGTRLFASYIGHDEEALFYLRARGLDAKEARRHLIDGFCEEIIRELPREAAPLLRQRIDELLA